MITSRDISRISQLYKMAESVEKVGAGRLASSIWYKGDLLSIGVNSMKSHPLQARFSVIPEKIYLHAETAAISRAIKDFRSIEGADLYVARVKSSGKGWLPGNAKSCAGCISCAEHFGIRNVFYSKDDGSIDVINLR